MQTIGKRQVIATHTLHLFPDEKSELDVVFMGETLQVIVEFERSAPERNLQIKGFSGGALITFNKWDTALGTAAQEPIQLATSSTGARLQFTAMTNIVGALARVEIQFSFVSE